LFWSVSGAYPADIIDFPRADAPAQQPGDVQLISQPLDFLGINYYYWITAVAGQPFNPTRPGMPVTDMGWDASTHRRRGF
jgi:beta-glucosidase